MGRRRVKRNRMGRRGLRERGWGGGGLRESLRGKAYDIHCFQSR